MTARTFLLAALLLPASSALAQDQSMTMGAMPALPAICGTVEPSHAMAPMGLDEAHTALAAGMDAMHAGMDTGITAEDIDVAFVCGMIPHHQGAIDMAKAELQYGNEPFAREMAEKVIAAQEAEIAAMLDWLAKR